MKKKNIKEEVKMNVKKYKRLKMKKQMNNRRKYAKQIWKKCK